MDSRPDPTSRRKSYCVPEGVKRWSRPEATDRAEKHGASMGIAPKPSGNRPVQPVSDRFFYWLRATMLETRRLGYWWANRMVQTTHPVEQKMALLWHGHFATHENKVRDYRKMV